MQSLLRVLDFLLQTPTTPNPIPYIPPNPSPSSENRLHHVQLSTSTSYDNDCPSIIYANTPFTHGDYMIRPISPTFIKYCNEQVLDFKVDLDTDSLLNITTVLSRPWGFERRFGFRLLTTQADSLLALISNVGFIETEFQVHPIHESFRRYSSERIIDVRIEWDLSEHLRRTTIISRAHGFEAEHDLPATITTPVTYHLPDPVRSEVTHNIIVQQDWMRNLST